MRPTRALARAATESGGAARTTMARSRASSVSATARTWAGKPTASRRACSRNWRASSTSAAAVTRPPRGATPAAYSLAASDVAATTRRDTASESVAWAADLDAAQALNNKPTNSLRWMEVSLSERPQILEWICREFKDVRRLVTLEHGDRDGGEMGVRE